MQVRRDVIFISTFYSTSGQRPLRFAGGSPFTRGNRERRVDFAIMGKAVVHWSRLETGRLANSMNTDLSLVELLALVEIVDEHVDRNFPGVDTPRVLREIQQKLDTVIARHRGEIDKTIKSAKKTRSGVRGSGNVRI